MCVCSLSQLSQGARLSHFAFLIFNFQEALKRKLKARIEYAKFLQDTVKEMAKEVQVSRSGEIKQTAEDLDEFLNKVSAHRVLFPELFNMLLVFLTLYFYDLKYSDLQLG